MNKGLYEAFILYSAITELFRLNSLIKLFMLIGWEKWAKYYFEVLVRDF
ncbi:hypothetical protein MNBD_BACTEROID01-240 [hydrothermal vent metagenome]|uniref:Uncharacterized protein n=1 Tax=hydrothermal vent metagenome TaxID=652676 RepID=A0A3B0T8N2_9ZZZZ